MSYNEAEAEPAQEPRTPFCFQIYKFMPDPIWANSELSSLFNYKQKVSLDSCHAQLQKLVTGKQKGRVLQMGLNNANQM